MMRKLLVQYAAVGVVAIAVPVGVIEAMRPRYTNQQSMNPEPDRETYVPGRITPI